MSGDPAEPVVDVSIVIVVYRTPEFLRDCLASIERARLRPPFEVIVLDNAPLDDASRRIAEGWTAAWAAEEPRPCVRYQANEKNLGYGRAVNQGMRLARGRYFLIINPDVEIGPGSVEALITHLEENPDTGLVAPRLHYPDGQLQPSCRTFYTLPIFLLRRTFLGKLFPDAAIIRDHLMLDWDHETTREVDWCIGGALLARRAAVDDVGPMDERFFLYFEDVDWCYRMKQRGWKVVYNPRSRMTHHYQRQSAGWRPSRGLWIHLASTVRFYEKWSFLLYWLKLRSPFLRQVAVFASDLLAVVVAFLLAYAARSAADQLLVKPLFAFERYSRFLFFTVVVAMGSFLTFGHYRERLRPAVLENLLPVMQALLWTTVLMMASTFLLSVRTYSRVVVVLFYPLATVLVTAGRVGLLRMVASVRERDLNLRRVGILGPPEAVQDLLGRFARYGRWGMEPIAIIAGAETTPSGTAAGPGVQPSVLIRRLRAERVQELLLFEDAPGDVPGLLAATRAEGIPVRLVPALRAVIPNEGALTNFLGLPSLVVGAESASAGRNPGRRLFDFLAATLVAVFGAVPFLLVSLSRVLRRRPVLERVVVRGRGGRKLALRRLRSEGDAPGLLASLLRYYPALPALASGELSLVGIYPFPEATWRELDPAYRASPPLALPGILGPWTGRPPSVGSLPAWNRRYVEHWSPANDLRILWKAIRGNRQGTGGTS